MNPNPQPDWLRETIGGLTTSHLYRVYLEGKTHAIVYCPGNNGYVDRMTGVKYMRSQYVLVQKGKGYWSRTWKTLHEGRLTNEVKATMKKALEDAEASQG